MEKIEDMPEYEIEKNMLRSMGMGEEKLDDDMYDLFAIIDMAMDSHFEE